MTAKKAPTVAIIGRPNVGKSSLFNRLIGRRKALVDETPGLTRDRLYGECEWKGQKLNIIDTGGLEFSTEDQFQEGIAVQVTQAMEEADVGVFVVDVMDGLVPLDAAVSDWLRHWQKPVFLAVNKADNEELTASAYEFASLGLENLMPISSLHGVGVGDLLDKVLAAWAETAPEETEAEEKDRPIRIAIIGRPNVGKSSFLNRLLQEERVLVSDVPGTTRDPVEALYTYGDRQFCFIDTAGVQSKRRLNTTMDAVARIKAYNTIKNADVCLGLIDASLGVVKDDMKLLNHVILAGKPLCLAVNKWDLTPKGASQHDARKEIHRRAPFLKFAAVQCMSAKTGSRVLNVLEKLEHAYQQSIKKVRSSECNRFLEEIQIMRRAPVRVRDAHWIRCYQTDVAPPTFHIMVRLRQTLRRTDLAFMENQLRKAFDFDGTPIRIHILSKRRERNAHR